MNIDPLALIKKLWPDVVLYDKQVEILYSVMNNDETMVPAGNQLGKDFVAGLIALVFFLTRTPCRVVTSSVDNGQLEKVLWGEIANFIQSSKYDLPLVVNHLDIKKLVRGSVDPKSYLIGRVAKAGEGLLGHHLARGADGKPSTLMIYDEASGISKDFKSKTDTWAHRTLVIGNPYPCENFFKKGVKEGDLKHPKEERYYRKVIKIKAEDSPNVKWAKLQKRRGIEPTGEIILPGVKSWDDYLKHRATWDEIRQCISLDAEFYEGASTLLLPPDWLNLAESHAEYAYTRNPGRRGMGVDTAEGGDSSTWAISDDSQGLILLESQKTPDTSKIPGLTIALMKQYNVDPENVCFDSGGGGKEHVDHLRSKGYNVQAIAFGGSATDPEAYLPHKHWSHRREDKESRETYTNRRAEMYGLARQVLNPVNNTGYGIPSKYTELRRQLAPLPLLYDGEGRMRMLSKSKKNPNSKENTIQDLIGRSPDDADAWVLSLFALYAESRAVKLGVLF